MKMNCLVGYGLFLLGISTCLSCRKGDEYKKFFGDGERIYAGRVDTVIVRPGNKRMLLSVVLGSDPLVSKIKAFWHDGADSIEQAVVHKPGQDTVNLMVDHLNEGSYNFVLYTYDQQQHRSVALHVSGTVYGASYSSSLVNRRLKEFGYNQEGTKLNFTWASSNLDEVGVELVYRHKDGQLKTVIFPPNQLNTSLSDFDATTDLKYRTLFKPDSNGVDTFFVDYVDLKVPDFERQLEKSKFSLFVLPTDATTAHGWLMPYLWDENYGTPGFATINRMPQWFTFDTGVSAAPSRFKIWQASDRIYSLQNLKKFEIWGTNAPDPDGSWESWTKLASCESKKPSGLPLGQNTDADINFVKAGEDFVMPSGLPKVRYIRFKVLETWGNDVFATMSELNIYTKDR